MASEEAVNLPCPFAGQDRAYRIDQAPAGLDHRSAEIKQMLLDGDDPFEPPGCQTPAALRIAPPGPAARTGRVDQDEVGPVAPVGQLGKLVGRVQQPRLDPRSGSLRARRKLAQAPP